jgi:hypothetical protein
LTTLELRSKLWGHSLMTLEASFTIVMFLWYWPHIGSLTLIENNILHIDQITQHHN